MMSSSRHQQWWECPIDVGRQVIALFLKDGKAGADDFCYKDIMLAVGTVDDKRVNKMYDVLLAWM